MTDFTARNQPYVAQGPTSIRQGAAAPNYKTQLSPLDEMAFRQWLAQRSVPFDPNAVSSDYDMRGFWQGLQQGNPQARTAVNQNDQLTHYPDYWKTPAHESFSSGSQWAAPVAPQWNAQDQLISPGARVLKDEPAEATATQSPQFVMPARPTTRLQNMSGLAASGDIALPEPQQRFYPTPPYYSGPGDEAFIKSRPLPLDRNTFDADQTMNYRASDNKTEDI